MRKANHYVAQSYQTRFCDSKGLIWVYDKETLRVKPQPPKRTAVMTHLYTVETDDGQKSDILERKVFDPLDGTIVDYINRWIQPGYRITNEDIPTMAYYLAFQHARVPRNIEMFKELGTAMAVKILKDAAANKKQMDEDYERMKVSTNGVCPISREQYQEWFENLEKHFTFELKDDFALGMTISVAVPQYYNAFSKMEWSIVDAPHGNFFITCDAPAVSVAFIEPGVVQYGVNLVSPGFEVIFPLCPTVCLWLRKVKGQKRFRCDSKRVDDFNYRTAFMAERYIFSHQDSYKVRALLRQTAKTRLQPKINRTDLYRRMDTKARLGPLYDPRSVY
ncbi:MAG: DUF4238 domain-containing protein [Verrucomicrobiia bacterium]|jgi:hypothetical protein